MQSPIAQARTDRGWSQTQLLRQLRTVAAIIGDTLPDDASLRISLSGWENGKHRPSAYYRQLLTTALELTDADLGFAPRIDSRPTAVGPDTVAYLDDAFAIHARADQRLGSRMLLPVVREQTAQAETWTRDARGPSRTAILRRVSRYAEFCGWLHQDQGDFQAADHWTRRAIEMSQELGDTGMVAYALMRRSNIATESGRPTDGLHLADAALHQQLGTNAQLTALALRQKATAHAMLGERRDCATSVDRGTAAAEVGTHDSRPESDYCTVSFVASEGAHALALAGQAEKALRLFTDALDGWPDGQHRDRGLALARLANVHADQSDPASACTAGHQAITALQIAPSARTAFALRQLRGKLTPHRRRGDVLELRERLAEAV